MTSVIEIQDLFGCRHSPLEKEGSIFIFTQSRTSNYSFAFSARLNATGH